MQSYVFRTLFMTFLLACLASLASAAALSSIHLEPKSDISPRVLYDLKDEGSVLSSSQEAQLSNSTTANLNSTAFRDSQSSASGAIANAASIGGLAPVLSLVAAGGVLVYGLELALVL